MERIFGGMSLPDLGTFALVNDRLDRLSDYPFTRLAALLSGVTPRTNAEPTMMSVGEPQHQPPAIRRQPFAAERLAVAAQAEEGGGEVGRRHRIRQGVGLGDAQQGPGLVRQTPHARLRPGAPGVGRGGEHRPPAVAVCGCMFGLPPGFLVPKEASETDHAFHPRIAGAWRWPGLISPNESRYSE